ncbi:putative ribonuclease H-like domain-containing protein, partial [Tanacetum coccineum]
MPALEDISIFDFSRGGEDDDAEIGMNNLDIIIQVSPNLTIRIHKDHPLDQVIGDLQSATQTRRMSKNLEEHGFVIHALKDPSWIEAMQEELLQFKLQEVWTLVDLPNRKRAIGTKWVFRNKKDERGIMIRNKARLVAQGYTQEEGIDYDEVFAPVVRIKAIKVFLAYASFKDFVVYQMDVKSIFLFETIEEEVYVCQPPGFEDPDFPDRVYKVEKALYGLHQAPRAWYETLSTYLLDNEFQRGKIDKTLFIKRYKGFHKVCGGPHYSSDCQTRNPLVYEPNPSNNYDFSSFDQPPQYHIDNSQQFYYCEHCGGPHYGSDYQMGNVFYEHAPYDNHDSSSSDQPSQFTPPQPFP